MLVGWSAVTGRVDLPALVLFAIIFYWTRPHFWALSLRFKDDYGRRSAHAAGGQGGQGDLDPDPVLHRAAGRRDLLLYPAGRMGAVVPAAAVALGGAFICGPLELRRNLDGRRAIRLFSFSTYLALLFAAMALDAVVRGGA